MTIALDSFEFPLQSRCESENGKKVDSINVDYFGVDGILLRHPESNVIRMRRKMRDAGTIVVTAIVNKKNKLAD